MLEPGSAAAHGSTRAPNLLFLPSPSPGLPALTHSLELPWGNTNCQRISKPPCLDGLVSTGQYVPCCLGHGVQSQVSSMQKEKETVLLGH